MKALSASQAAALRAAHESFEGKVSGVRVDTLRVLAAAGLVTIHSEHHSRNGHINWGRDVSYRPVKTVSHEATITPEGQAYAVASFGIPPRVECRVEACHCLATTPAGYCGQGCERSAAL